MSSEIFLPFIAELIRWNKSINLVQENTLSMIQERHILNSLQLQPHINYETDIIVDIGSGAGFPGIILAIDGAKNVHLVEPTRKKTVFLNHIKKLYNLPTTIHECQWQKLKIKNANIITSRAFASLSTLLEAMYFVSRETIEEAKGIFLKGAKVQEEIKEAKNNWSFEMEIFKDSNHDAGCVLKVWSLQKK